MKYIIKDSQLYNFMIGYLDNFLNRVTVSEYDSFIVVQSIHADDIEIGSISVENGQMKKIFVIFMQVITS